MAPLLIACMGCTGDSAVPTARVEQGAFERDVVVDGYLVAREVTPIAVPQEAERPMRIEWLVADGTAVSPGDRIATFDETELRLERDDALSDRSKAELQLDDRRATTGADARQSELDAAMARREREVAETYQRSDEEIFSRHERVESELDRDLARAKERHALEAFEVRGRVAAGAESLIVLDRRKAEIALDRAASGLSALTVKAPRAGLVQLQRDWRGNAFRLGDTVFPGQVLAEIPDLAAMQAEVYVLEADAAGMRVGASAEVRLESRPEAPLVGRIERLDKVAKPRHRNSPVQYFGATLGLDLPAGLAVRPGQRVRARLTLERRVDALSVPLTAIFERDGVTQVFRKRGDRFEPLTVLVEARSAGAAVISGPIAAGDELAIASPPGLAGDESASQAGAVVP